MSRSEHYVLPPSAELIVVDSLCPICRAYFAIDLRTPGEYYCCAYGHRVKESGREHRPYSARNDPPQTHYSMYYHDLRNLKPLRPYPLIDGIDY